MMKTTLVLVIEHSKPIPELTDLAAGRIYTLDGVEDVTAELQPERLAEQARVTVLERWGRFHNGDWLVLKRADYGYWTPWHIAQAALDAALTSQSTPEPAVAEQAKIGCCITDMIDAALASKNPPEAA